jgi:hypothetical protein
MLEKVVLTALVCGLFALMIAAALGAMYYFWATIGGIKEDKKWLLNWTAPFFLIFPLIWAADGRKARIRLLVSIVIFLLAFGILKFLINK